MWYRHDFGLLPEAERRRVRFHAREWLRAWEKVATSGAVRRMVVDALAGDDKRWCGCGDALAPSQAQCSICGSLDRAP